MAPSVWERMARSSCGCGSKPVNFGDTGEILVNILPTYRLAVSESMHNRRARVFHPALQLMSCLSFVRGEGHTLWLEGSYPFCEVLSLSATGGLLSLVSEKREGTPPRFYASRPALSSESALVAHLFGGSVQRLNTRAVRDGFSG